MTGEKLNALAHHWDEIFENGEECQSCIYNESTTDYYGTGDSPTMRECMVISPTDCPAINLTEQ